MDRITKRPIPVLSAIDSLGVGLTVHASRAPLTTLLNHVYTLYLFTKSDIKTVLIPVTCFGVAAAPDPHLVNAIHAAVWLWMHILQADVSNQTLSPEEDKQNKPYRPLPAGRITLRDAVILRWALVPVCCLYSLWYSREVFCASVIFSALVILYNEVEGHSSHWTVRNGLNALGYAAFETGTSLVANNDRSLFDRTGIVALSYSVTIIATTIHTQDFQDVEGDTSIGRRTLAITHPEFARLITPVLLVAWSFLSWYVWELGWLTKMGFVLLAGVAGVRIFCLRSEPHDKITYHYWYNTWLSIAHMLPGYHRFYYS